MKNKTSTKKKRIRRHSSDEFLEYHKEFTSLNFRSPFTDEINHIHVPRKLNRPVLGRYDDMTDPDNHVSNFMQTIRTITMN